jgi:flagella basal body P-ring formation protein FlgA
MKTLIVAALALGFGSLSLGSAFALPVLDAQVETPNRVVTVGDMFKNAGDLASQPLFLAPAPGTSGIVSLDDIRAAAAKAGLAEFDDGGATGVRVSRAATAVTPSTLAALVSADLKARGLLAPGVSIEAAFDASLSGLAAAAVPDAVQLVNLRYAPDSGLFAARFSLAGVADPLDVTGQLQLMTTAPELTETLAAGTILTADDIMQQQVPLSLVTNGNVATTDQLIGKALQRQSRAGMVLRVTDVADPQIVSRNDLVTVYLHLGAMTLTVKGRALNAASVGEPVAVLNTVSNHVVHGIARADGAVEISSGPLSVAGL